MKKPPNKNKNNFEKCVIVLNLLKLFDLFLWAQVIEQLKILDLLQAIYQIPVVNV